MIFVCRQFRHTLLPKVTPSDNHSEYTDLHSISILKNTPTDMKEACDVFCLGMLLLEVMTISASWHDYSAICRMVSQGDKEIVFANIANRTVKDFISQCLMDDP